MEKFVFFGGKGGVGKTTVSSAYALKCARTGLDTLIVSTDPAHSTADVFDQPFGDDPQPVDGIEHLWALEIDPDAEVEAHMMEIKRTMADQVSPAIVNEIDRQIELAHNTPGAYEAALFDRVIDVMGESDDFDRVVFDTSPTGGTLRLLALPQYLESWIDRLVTKRAKSIDLFEKAAIGKQRARVRAEKDPIIARLRNRKERFEFAGKTLREDAAFFPVLNPDELSVKETERSVEQLESHDLDVKGLIINKVTPEPDTDETGRGSQYLREKCATERERISTVRETFAYPVVATIETRIAEIKGELLEEVAAELGIDVAVDHVA